MRNVGEILSNFDQDIKKIVSLVDKEDAEAILKGEPVFRNLFERYIKDKGWAVDWNKVKSIPAEEFHEYGTLPPVRDDEVKELLNKIVVVCLNGGLGTSMGCDGPKSVLVVRDGKTFMDLRVEQISFLNSTYGCDIPFVLMNSFYTEAETRKHLSKYMKMNVHFYTFCQNMCPRVEHQSLRPLMDKQSPMANYKWYPPGHGDFYDSFYSSGLIDEFLKQGKEVVFVSNIDNLGATIESAIIKYFLKAKLEFLMELTPKSLADVKGGTLVRYEERIRLLELTQVPKEHVKTFKNVNHFSCFNTNNIWISLQGIKNVVDEGKLVVEIIVNPKTVSNIEVIQLETAIGSAIKCFGRTGGLVVPRKRFLPVKKSQDLLVIMSNLYEVRNGSLFMSSSRVFQTTPVVKLGSEFDKVTDFRSRFRTIPDIQDLHHLTISGNVFFGSNVTLKGTVIIIADDRSSIFIPNNAVLEDQIVTGSLKMLDL